MKKKDQRKSRQHEKFHEKTSLTKINATTLLGARGGGGGVSSALGYLCHDRQGMMRGGGGVREMD